jgi:hypothetical protein
MKYVSANEKAVSLNLHRYISGSTGSLSGLFNDLSEFANGVADAANSVGRCTLTPPDPYLKGAWYPGGFKPLPLNINPGFKICLSKFNLRRYSSELRVLDSFGREMSEAAAAGALPIYPISTHCFTQT